MRERRRLIDGAPHHVTSRTNNKIRIFDDHSSRRIMLLILKKAKEKYGFTLHNFCVMPTHIHLLITPAEGTNLSRIIQWIKTRSAQRLNLTRGSKDHLWGERFFAQPITNIHEYTAIHEYIDQNPVRAGLVQDPAKWRASGAYYRNK